MRMCRLLAYDLDTLRMFGFQRRRSKTSKWASINGVHIKGKYIFFTKVKPNFGNNLWRGREGSTWLSKSITIKRWWHLFVIICHHRQWITSDMSNLVIRINPHIFIHIPPWFRWTRSVHWYWIAVGLQTVQLLYVLII